MRRAEVENQVKTHLARLRTSLAAVLMMRNCLRLPVLQMSSRLGLHSAHSDGRVWTRRLVLVGVLCLTGCTSGGDIDEARPSLGASATQSEDVSGVTVAVPDGPTPPRPTTAAEALQHNWDGLGLPGEPPDVDVVRIISPDEWGEVYYPCMEEQGFPSHTDQFGQVGIGFEREQHDDVKLAGYVCDAKYPLDDKYFRPFDSEQLQLIYDWRVGTTIACLESFGGVVPPAPSFEVFAAEYESTGYVLWSPISDPGLTFPEDTDMDAVLATCPESPPDDIIYH